MKFARAAIALSALQGAFLVAATAAPMAISVERKNDIDRMIEAPTTIFLSGDIEADTPYRLREALKGVKDHWVSVVLDSPGGNLMAGMEIGRILRSRKATITVGSKAEPYKPKAGMCLSACSLAFLGGTYRYMAPGSVYGVHRASSIVGPRPTDLDSGQIVSAAIGAYIREMDVEPALLDLTVKAGKDGMYMLSAAELKSLRVINNGRKQPTWSIEVVEGGTYLRGSQETLYGMGKSMFMCIGGRYEFMSVYTAGTKAETIAKQAWEHSIVIDDDPVPLPPPRRIESDGEFVNASFRITPEIMRRLQSASKVGHAMQLSREAPTFVGYNIDIDPESKAKVRTYAKNCVN